MNEGQSNKKSLAEKQRDKKYLSLEEFDKMLESARRRGELDQQWWLM